MKKIVPYDIVFVLFILASPLLVYGFDLSGVSIRLSRLVLLMLLPLFFLKIMRRPYLLMRDRFFLFVIAPFTLYSALSLAWTSGDEGVASRLGGLFEVMLIYAIMIVADLHGKRFYSFVKWYVASAVVPVALSLWQLANNMFHFSSTELPFSTFLIENKYEVLEQRYFVSAEGFSRLSSTFAEPVIFSNYICSVLLLSFVLNPAGDKARSCLRIFQVLLLLVIILSISKLALLSLVMGGIIIGFKIKEYRKLVIYVILSVSAVVGVAIYLDVLMIFERLLSSSGHLELLQETLENLPNLNYVFGEGIGSIPYGSTHRFVLSRIYEAGFMGISFALAVTFSPALIYRLRIQDVSLFRLKFICFGVLFSVVFGLNMYDFFVHLFPWIVIGSVMSFYNAQRYMQKRVGRAAVSTDLMAVRSS